MSEFQPSSYTPNYGYGGTVDPALVSQLITSGTQIADSAITAAGGRKKGSGRRRHKAKLEEIEAAEPDHSPMWPIAAGLGLIAIVGGYLATRPARPAARAAA